MKTSSPFTTHPDGSKYWNVVSGETYAVTGVDRRGKRFKIESSNYQHISHINVWRGTFWLVRGNQRWVIRQIYN